MVATISRPNSPVRKDRTQGLPDGFVPSGKALMPSICLDIPFELTQRSERPPRKKKPLSKKARHRILHLTGLMREENKHRQVFCTGTLPGSTVEAMEAFNGSYSYAVKLLITYLPRYLEVKASELSWVYCWEFQGRGALHLHIGVECEREATAQMLVDVWDSIWGRILRNIDAKSTCDIFGRAQGGSWRNRPDKWQSDSQIVTDGISRYLSKYLSKGDKRWAKYYPSRWWGASASIRSRLGDWLLSHTLIAPDCIKNTVNSKDARGAFRAAVEENCIGRVKDISAYFQDRVFTFLGYISGGQTVRELTDRIAMFMEKMDMTIDGLSRKAGIRSIEQKREDIWSKFLAASGERLQIAVVRHVFPGDVEPEMTDFYRTANGFSMFMYGLRYELAIGTIVRDWNRRPLEYLLEQGDKLCGD